ncbi:hypothetical protein YH65_04320 [Sulfurovum lithotrophicum]|uniref:Outer membrane lipoprotein carrier protein LolA n=1 Tax=Sulfurovum lithotrophicum TaxID=206403 RepID=A0A7U4RQG0_9BACT|nr:LolA-like outer membrane lipoprotein chaperone [Sulfurovum lithotrophicum]AKF24697.1 hypothetical protein YH65_04320 [Sulfurovum lithotrophicum]
MRKILVCMAIGFSLYADGITLPEHFKANFVQMITNPKKKIIQYSGKVRFSIPSLMKWEYTRPTRKEVCTDGRELRVVDHDLEQVSIYLISKGFNLNEIVKKAKLHSENIYVARYEGKSYTIQVDGKKRLQSIAYFDELDNKVQIVFKNIKYGKGALGLESMRCSAPKAYDMIRG